MLRKEIFNWFLILFFLVNPWFLNEGFGQSVAVPGVLFPSGAKPNPILTTAMKDRSYFLKKGGPTLPPTQESRPVIFVYSASQSYDAVKTFFTQKGLKLKESLGHPKAKDYKSASGATTNGWNILIENKKFNPVTKKWVLITTITYIKIP